MTKVFAYTEMFTNLATVVMLAVLPAAVIGFTVLSV